MVSDLLALVAVFFAALAWGANEPWAMMIIGASSLVALGLRLLLDGRSGAVRIPRAPVLLPAVLFLGYALVQASNPRVALGADAVVPHTVEPCSTLLYLLLYAGYVALVTTVILGFKSRRSVRWLLLALIVLGVFEALYGLVQYLGKHPYVWNYPVEAQGNIARGTLINRNHYALLLNITLAAGVGHLYYRSIRVLRRQDLTLRHVIATPGSAQLAWIVLCLALIGLALVFSMSRMGIIAMFAALGVMIAAVRAAEGTRRARVLGLILLVAIISLALYAGVDAVLARYEGIAGAGYLEKGRVPIWRDSLKLIAQQPFWGRGLGTYQWTFPAFQKYEPDTPARYAHNDYLQVLAETGVVGLLLLLWAFAAAWRTAARNLRRAADPLTRGIGLATLGALAAVVLQEATDFSLYVPGVAALFAALVGLNERAALPCDEGPD